VICGWLRRKSCPSCPSAENASWLWLCAEENTDMGGGNPGTAIVVIGVKESGLCGEGRW